MEFDWPSTPDVSERVLARIQQRPRSRRWPVLAVVAALLIPAGAATAISGDIQEWLGLRSVDVKIAPAPTSVPTPGPATPVTAAQAQDIAGFAPVLPPALGTPDEIRARPEEIRLRYGDLRLFELKGEFPRELIGKVIASGEGARRVPGGGVFFAGEHFFLYLRPDGTIKEGRTAQNTLVIERGDLVFRLEGRDLTAAEAQRLLAP
jgi:hypothetical protein